MAIQIEKCNLFRSRMMALRSDLVPVEGKALVHAFENGVACVAYSTGANGEQFAGISVSEPDQTPTSLNQIETVTVDDDGYATLSRTPIASSIAVAGYTEGNGTSASTFNVTGNRFRVPAADRGKDFTVAYSYSPSVVESLTKFGSNWPGGNPAAQIGVTGVVQNGEMYTTEYDNEADWSNPTTIRLGADGKFTTGGSGTIVPNGRVTKIPGVGDALLGIQY